MLVGAAGGGKTHLVGSVAEALKLQFYPMSVGLQTTKSDLLGFINAHGTYVTTPIREAYEKGGVLLLDEFDATHAGVVTILNSLLANGHCSFPDKIVEKHKDFVCICACNTYGKGGNTDYVGRNRLDAATLDRFIVIDVAYDNKLEEALTNNKNWLNLVRKIRSNAEKQGVKIVISPRASIDGADLLDAGFKLKEALDMVVFKGANKDIQDKLLKDIILEEYEGGQEAESKSKSSSRSSKRNIFLDFDNNIYNVSISMPEIEIELANNKALRIRETCNPYLDNESLWLSQRRRKFERVEEEDYCTEYQKDNFLNALIATKRQGTIFDLPFKLQIELIYKGEHFDFYLE